MARPTAQARAYVAYFRVSTRKQGVSGLGLAAQQDCVERMVRERGGRLVATFQEIESGRRGDRPELQRAIQAARAHRATLIVAKLDRLSRNAAFLLALRDAGVEILACDLPDVNRIVVGIMGLVAEEEARLISERTKAALAAAKRRGVRLGTPENLSSSARRKGQRLGAAARRAKANARASELAPVIAELRERGAVSLRQIARGLDERSLTTERGSSWTATTVSRLLARIDAGA